MRAAVLTGPGVFELRECDVPEPKRGEVRVKLEGCGVCASSIPAWEGRPWFEYPFEAGAPGHEGWGTIDELGDDVAGFTVGERVALLSQRAHAEYDVVATSALVPLPASLYKLPFPGEPLGCAMNVLERAAVTAGHTVAVIGVGFLGALLVELASRVGAQVIAISRRPFSLELARRCGAREVIAFDNSPGVVDRVLSLTGGQGCRRVIEASGAQDALTLAGEVCAVGARLVIAGYHQDGLREVDMQLWNWRGLDVINAHERREERYLSGMNEAVAAVLEGRLNPWPLMTHTFELSDLAAAYAAARSRPDGFMKALVTV